jgi:integrase
VQVSKFIGRSGFVRLFLGDRYSLPIAKAVRPWVEGIEGKLIKYRVPIAEKNRVLGGPTHFERASRPPGIRSAKRSASTAPHPRRYGNTTLTWLAERGVHPEQRQVLAGHARQGTTARNYEHLSPDYLRDAIAQIDAFFDELAKHTKAHLRYACDTQLQLELAA